MTRGAWQGRADVREEGERTLVIRALKPEGDQWIADGHDGTTGKGLAHGKRVDRRLELTSTSD